MIISRTLSMRAVAAIVVAMALTACQKPPAAGSISKGAHAKGAGENVQKAPDEVGEISYYANSLAGNATANGEIYQPEEMTCAHRKFPFGTILEIRELKSGKVATCRVNDRGPYAKGRILDVSRAVATKLGFLEDGHVDAELRRLSVEPKGTAAPAAQP